jgi:hypothetical protein
MAHKIPALTLAASLVSLAFATGVPMTAQAHFVPAPCDFITAGGFVFKDNGNMVNFGAHGGCKNGEFWGNFNVIDHENNFQMKAEQITGYLFDPEFPDGRDICGWARINNADNLVQFRIRLNDKGEPGKKDSFGIVIDNQHTAGERFYKVSVRLLANGDGGGGNVQLHKSNPSNTLQPGFFSLREYEMCGDLDRPD